ncbi:hypothetical protein EG799_10080 [Aurantiacibacter spongiae]|uniref:Tetratricopeptide repeat protein n=2 Tax=Aurantiacibacter spongiae TaxID=2488860 RepID=A0A3N5D192_9SPHN|nr:hypothetical protein EG799_10080 [Aurantiacibacter spongiae]
MLALGLGAAPAAAQDSRRIDRLEQQIQALQRAVFPGGDERYFEPEIRPEQRPQQTTTPEVGTTALTDVLERLNAIETQLARLTAATEVNENALSTISARLDALEALAADAGLAAGGVAANTATPRQPTGRIPVPGEGGSGRGELPAANPAPPAPPAAGPSPERVAAVQAIAKPATGDAGEDEYTYGFRLWDAGFYPEAQQQLALFVERYPNHPMISYGRNLLGRAFLDAGDARAAATHFFDNYQADKTAARAPDSLLFLAESMIELGDTRRACIALAEFGDTYPALAVGRLQTMYDNLGSRVDCS